MITGIIEPPLEPIVMVATRNKSLQLQMCNCHNFQFYQLSVTEKLHKGHAITSTYFWNIFIQWQAI